MGAIIDGLPIGADRNQINYLAEQMDSFKVVAGFPPLMYDQLTANHTVGVTESFFNDPHYSGYGTSRLDIYEMVRDALNQYGLSEPDNGQMLTIALRADFDISFFFTGNVPASVSTLCMVLNVRQGYQDNSPIIQTTRLPISAIAHPNGTAFRAIGGRTLSLDLPFILDDGFYLSFDLDWTFHPDSKDDYTYEFGNSECALTIVNGFVSSPSLNIPIDFGPVM